MKIWCQLPKSMPQDSPDFKTYYELLLADYNMVKRPDTEVVIKDVPTAPSETYDISYLGIRALLDHHILRTMLQAEREGYDAIAGACYFDGAIKEADNLMSIPVVGAAEASMHLASMLGDHFAVVTSEPKWVFEMEKHIIECGMRDSALPVNPVRSLTISFATLKDCLRGNYQPVIDDFKKVAQTCLKDGADTIIAGCGLFSPMLTQSGIVNFEGVPIIDPMLASLKVAELMVDFRNAGIDFETARGRFIRPTVSQVNKVLELEGWL